MHVVVDAAGGDNAPLEPVKGAVKAAADFPDTTITLVGPEEDIEKILAQSDALPANLGILPATESIGMHESPVRALREKKNSSINIGIKMVADGDADAFLSAGNTGAVVAASTLKMGLLQGVQRPGIAIPVIALDHPVVIIDVGANIHCKPTHLLQYGIMASLFAQNVLSMDNPRVGLLNVGEEERKGTDLQKEAFDLLHESRLNFVGNIEAHDIFFGGCDIVICEGFVGNVLLKTCESLVQKIMEYFKTQIQESFRRKIGFALCKDVFKTTKEMADYAEYGGALLLGVNGVTIISHGKSDARAIYSAIREARSFISHGVNNIISEYVAT
jgi:glycerol-3-phosphate acyltransferase PlsX